MPKTYLIATLTIISAILSFGCSANGGALRSSTHAQTAASKSASYSVDTATPDYDDVAGLVGDAKIALHDDSDAINIGHRIMDGFEAGPHHVAFKNGLSVYSGFKYGEGTVQSVAVYDKHGRIKLTAIVNQVGRLSEYTPRTRIQSQYMESMNKRHLKPDVFIFTRTEQDLKAFLPIYLRWQQANIIGRRISCKKSKYENRCQEIRNIKIPTKAFIVDTKTNNTQEINIPDVDPTDMPLDAF